MIRKLLSLLLVFVAFVGLGLVSAASLSGTITVSNSAPSVSGISVSTSSVTPGQYFTVTVTVSDENTLQDIQTVKIVLYSSSVTSGSADDVRNHYTFTWDASTGWSASPSGYIDAAGSSTPADMTSTSGSWTFRIKLDETAEPTSWSVYAYVEDKGAASGSSTSSAAFNVNVYISFSLDDTSLSFSGSPGQTGVAASENPTTVTVTANVNFDVQVYGSGDWTGANYGDKIPLGNTKAAPSSDGTGAISLSTTAKTLYSGVAYGKGVQKPIYWFLDIPTGIRADTYSTTLYVEVVQA